MEGWARGILGGPSEAAEAELRGAWRLGGWRVGGGAGGLALAGDPLLEGVARADLSWGWRGGGWRLGGSAGGAWMRAGGAGRWLPEGAAEASLPLAPSLALNARGLVAAVHPALHPEGGPLVFGLLEVRLR